MESSWPYVSVKTKVVAWTGYFVACFAGSFVIEKWWLFLFYVLFLVVLMNTGFYYENKKRQPANVELFELVPTPGVDQCSGCKHTWGDHQLIALYGPENGGFGACPVEGCACIFTWNVAQAGSTKCGVCGKKGHTPRECDRMEAVREEFKK